MPKFTSLHRPVGPHFLDLSDCQCDDALYDEAFGPTVTIHRCLDDSGFEEQFFSREFDDKPYNPLEKEDKVEFLAEIQEWIKSRYGAYLDSGPEIEEDEPCAAGMQYGCRRAYLKATASYYARKYFCYTDPKRNRGRKPRIWWSALANERRTRFGV